MRRYPLIAALLVGLLAACGGDGGASSTVASTVADGAVTSSPTLEEASPGSWIDLLALVPDSPAMASYVVINDYQAARQLLDIGVPSAAFGSGPVAEYLLTLSLGPISDDSTTPATRSPRVGLVDGSFGNRAPYDTAAWDTAVGFSVIDVDRSLVAGVPPAELTVWQGRIDPMTVAAAVAADPAWSPDLRSVDLAGATYFTWGDDATATDLERVDPVRPLGRGGCLHASDGFATRTVACDVLEASLSAASGSADSLADGDALARLAAALEISGAYAAFLTTDVGVFAADALPSPTEGLVPYVAAATGVTLDGETSVLLVALLHDDDEAAAENAVRLQQTVTEGSSSVTGQPWSDLLTIIDSTVEGEMLLVRLQSGGPGDLWFRLVALRDSLLAWG